MKTFITTVLSIAIGFGIGILVLTTRPQNPTHPEYEKRDTVFVYDTVRYGKDELADATTELPPAPQPEYIYVPEIIIKKEVVHDTTYIVLPRRQYYTEKEGLCIWHSGVQSRIDSVDYASRSYVIKPVPQKPKKNTVSVGMEVGYANAFRSPLYVQYERRIEDWFSVYAKVEHDLISRETGAHLGGKFNINW